MWLVELADMAVQKSGIKQQQLWNQWFSDIENLETWNCQKEEDTRPDLNDILDELDMIYFEDRGLYSCSTPNHETTTV